MTLTRTENTTGRLPIIDVTRGVAIMMMIVYHSAWDMTYLGLADIPLFENAFWLNFRLFIPAVFLVLVGISLVLATKGGIVWGRFVKRVAQIAGAALLVTVTSYILFPDHVIFIGVLHAIALFSLLSVPFLKAPTWALCLLAPLFWAGNTLFADPFFDRAALQWIGLMTYFPDTLDYVPVFPWFGWVLGGVVLARLFKLDGDAPKMPAHRFERGYLRGLQWCGRRALAIYLLHQPLLFGTFYLIA